MILPMILLLLGWLLSSNLVQAQSVRSAELQNPPVEQTTCFIILLGPQAVATNKLAQSILNGRQLPPPVNGIAFANLTCVGEGLPVAIQGLPALQSFAANFKGVHFQPVSNSPATLVIADQNLGINNTLISLQTNASTHLLIRNATAAIANSNFVGCSAANVGVLQAEAASALILYNSLFEGNQAANTSSVAVIGATINTFSASFLNSSGNATQGQLYIGRSAAAYLHDSTFSNNSAVAGGAIYADAGSALTLQRTNFVFNSAVYGGTVYSTNSQTFVTGCSFVSGFAFQQGGALFQNNTFISIFSSTFNSSSAYLGGALALLNPQSGTINQTNFISNNASQGGAVFQSGGSLSLDQILVANNAASQGGAIWRSGQGNITRTVTAGNSAPSGSTLYQTSSPAVSPQQFTFHPSVSDLTTALAEPPSAITYCQTLTVSNHLQATVEAQLRAGSPERYSLSPSSITVKPGQSVTVDVRLRLLRFANKQKAVEQGQRDIFHIKASTAGAAYFEQKFYSTFYLAPEELNMDLDTPQSSSRRPEPIARASMPRLRSRSPPGATMLAAAGRDAAAAALAQLPPQAERPQQGRQSPRGHHPAAAAAAGAQSGAAGRLPDVGSQHGHGTDGHAAPLEDPSLQHLYYGEQAVPAAQPSVVSEPQPSLSPRHKDEQIRLLQGELSMFKSKLALEQRASRMDAPAKLASADISVRAFAEQLQVQTATLEGANAQLRGRVQELATELQGATEELAVLQQLRNELEGSASPRVESVVNAAVARERTLQEARNRKVLELLNSKDDLINSCEARLTELQSENAALQSSFQDSQKRLETAESRLSEVLEARAALRRKLETRDTEAAAIQASLQADIDVLKDQLASQLPAKPRGAASPQPGRMAAQLRAELEVHKDALRTAQEEVQQLSATLEKANIMIESLQSNVGHKAQQLQELEHSHKASQGSIAQLQQQVVRLGGALPDRDDSCDSAVDVSLDAGLGLGPPQQCPESPAALQRRVWELEAANEGLERALADARRQCASVLSPKTMRGASSSAGAFEATIQHLRSLLSERDRQLGRLEAEVAMLRAGRPGEPRTGETGPLQDGDALRAEIDALRRRLAEKDAQVLTGEERLSRLEAVHRVAQHTALRSEAQLESTQRCLAELNDDKAAGRQDAEAARALAMRLNARISEVTLAEQCARADADSARAELTRVHERHQADIDALEQRQRQLVAALQAVGAKVDPELSAAALAESPRTKEAARSAVGVSERNQRQAVEEVEIALAVMQAKLLEADAARREALKQLQDARSAADGERAQYEQQVRRAREEGSARITALEEVVKKLSNRSDLHEEIARLGGEVTFLRRSEARLKSDLGFAEQRVADLQRDHSALRQQLGGYEATEHEARLMEDVRRTVSAGVGPGGVRVRAPLPDLTTESQHHVVASLVERAEAAEVQTRQLQSELAALRQSASARAAAGGAGSAAAISAAEAFEERSGSLQRQLLLQQSSLQQLREDMEVQEVEKARLQAQLTEAAREVAAAHTRVAECERLLHSTREAAEGKAPAEAARWREVSLAARRQSEAERVSEAATAAKQEAEQALAASQLNMIRLKVIALVSGLGKLEAELSAKVGLLKRAEAQLQEHREQADRAASALQRDLQHAQGEAEERRVQLLVLMETVETLQAGTPGEKDQRIVSLTAQLTSARMREVVEERRGSELHCELEGTRRELHQAKLELNKAQQAVTDRDHQLTLAAAAAEGQARALTARKADAGAGAEVNLKLTRELDDAKATLDKADAEITGLQAALESARARHFEQLSRERAEASAALRQALANAMAPPLSPVASHADDVLVPSAEASSMETGSMGAKLSSGIDHLIAMLRPNQASEGYRSEDGASEASVGVNEERPHRVVSRLKQMLLDAEAKNSKAAADARIAQAEAGALGTKVRSLEAALEERTVQCDTALAERTADMESASSVQHAVARRDAEIRAYFDAEVVRLLLVPEQQERSLHLTREMCALKLAQQQLIASHAAAKRRGDAVALQAIGLKSALQEAEARLSALQDKAGHAALADQSAAVAELNARMAAKSQELYRLQEQLQQQRQATAAKELQVHEAQSAEGAAAAAAKQARADADRAQEQLQARLDREHTRERDALLKELERAHQQHRDAVQQAQQAAWVPGAAARAQNVAALVAVLAAEQQRAAQQLAALHQDADRALAERPEAQELEEALQRAAAAEESAHHLERQAMTSQEEVDRLSSQVQKMELEAIELRADTETRGAAVEGLQGMLARIEASVEQHRGGTSPLAGGARRIPLGRGAGSRSGAAAGRSEHSEDVSVVALSRQLVQCKMAEADAQRKLRVSARAEVVLQNRLLDREQRISELKQMLSAAAKRQQATSGQARHLTAVPVAASTHLSVARDAMGSPRQLLSPRQHAAPADQSLLHQGSRLATAKQGQDGGTGCQGASPRGQNDITQLMQQVTDLRVALARREAEVEHLSSELAQAVVTCVQPGVPHSSEDLRKHGERIITSHSYLPEVRTKEHYLQDVGEHQDRADHLQRKLVDLQRDCVAAVRAAEAATGRRPTPPGSPRSSGSGDEAAGSAHIRLAVQALVEKLKERDASNKRLRAAAKAAEGKAARDKAAAAAQPLEASQRAVIRDLSLKVATLTRANNSLRDERTRAQERLRTLRVALGSAKMPNVYESTPEGSSRDRTPPRINRTPPRHTQAGGRHAGSRGRQEQHQEGSLGDHKVLLETQAVLGLCQLLEHHVAVVEQAQQAVNPLLQPGEHPAEEEAVATALSSTQLLVSLGARQVLANSAAACAAELGSMRSTLHVLAAHLEALQGSPAQHPAAAEDVADLQSPGSVAQASPPQPLLLPPPPAPKAVSAETQADTLSESSGQEDAMAKQLEEATQRASKWKLRCTDLRRELASAHSARTALEAALHERLFAAEKAAEERSGCHRQQIARLEAALAGAEAARQQLEAQGAAKSSTDSGDARTAAATLAEAEARAGALQSQIDTLRSHAAASQSGLQEEVQSLRAALSKEKGERARIVTSLRNTITGLREASNVEGRLKSDLMQVQEQLAAANAALERAEAKGEQRRSECKALHTRVEALQHRLQQKDADLELAGHQATLKASQLSATIQSLKDDLATASTEHRVAEQEWLTKLQTAEATCQSYQDARGELEERLKQLSAQRDEAQRLRCEGQATVDALRDEKNDCAAARWASLLRCRRYQAVVHQLRQELKASQGERSSLDHELEGAVLKASQIECREQTEARKAALECERLTKRIHDLREFNENERQRALKDITNANDERSRLSGEIEALRRQFKAYQGLKAVEVSRLEHRLRGCLQRLGPLGGRGEGAEARWLAGRQFADLLAATTTWVDNGTIEAGNPAVVQLHEDPSDTGDSHAAEEDSLGSFSFGQGGIPAFIGSGDPTTFTSASEVGCVLESEAVAAAVREADFERMQRESCEAALARSQEAADKLRLKLKACQHPWKQTSTAAGPPARDLRAAQEVAVSTAAQAAERQTSREDVATLREQLAAAQEAARMAKADSARRHKQLQALQQQGSESPHLVANAAFLAEKAAKEAAEQKLATLRRTLTHKEQLLKDVRAKLEEAQSALQQAKATDRSEELAAAEARARALQTSLHRKEGVVRDLHERVHSLTRAATQRDEEQNGDTVQAQLRKAQADVARRDVQLRTAQREAEQARQQAATAQAAADACRKELAQAEAQARDQQAGLQGRAEALVEALRSLIRMALRSAAAMQAAMQAAGSHGKRQQPEADVSAEAIACMVDMSPDEVQDVLGSTASSASGAQQAIMQLARHASDTLMQLQAGLSSS
eukprot:jgi/Astpho2/304/Aster-02189